MNFIYFQWVSKNIVSLTQIFDNLCVCVCVFTEARKDALDPKLSAVVTLLIWVLRTKHRSSIKAGSALNPEPPPQAHIW